MFSRRGKPLTPKIKKIVVSVKQYFDRNKSTSREPSVKRTADAIGIGVASIKRIMADYNRDPDLLDKPTKMRGRPVYAVDISHQESVRTYIRSANSKGVRSQHLKEKDHIVAARQRYLREMRNNREPGGGSTDTIRPEVYLDES